MESNNPTAEKLRGKSVEELQQEVETLMKERFDYRMRKSTGQFPQTHLLKQISRDIARVKTIIVEKQRQS